MNQWFSEWFIKRKNCLTLHLDHILFSLILNKIDRQTWWFCLNQYFLFFLPHAYLRNLHNNIRFHEFFLLLYDHYDAEYLWEYLFQFLKSFQTMTWWRNQTAYHETQEDLGFWIPFLNYKIHKLPYLFFQFKICWKNHLFVCKKIQ